MARSCSHEEQSCEIGASQRGQERWNMEAEKSAGLGAVTKL
jgi:hypothetical protein